MSGTNEQPVILRVLIVEDTAERQKWLKSLYREHAWIMVHTAARAIRLIQCYDFDLISLDFNLAGPENGDAVAKVIATSRNAQTPVLIHSMNAPKASRLVEGLSQAICIPVSALMKSNATVKRVREALRQGVPKEWQKLLTGKSEDG